MIVPDNAKYVELQTQARSRHDMEVLFKMLNPDRAPSTLQVHVHRRNRGSGYKQDRGRWDPRDTLHHIINLKNSGLNVTVMADRSLRPFEPYPGGEASQTELDWVDVSSWLDPPTEEDREVLKLANHGWEADIWDIGNEPLGQSIKKFGQGGLCLPCEGFRRCRIPKHRDRDCTDHSWHAGFYRAVSHDLSERTLERELMDGEFDSCKFCPDERLVESVGRRTMEVCFLKTDPNLRDR